MEKVNCLRCRFRHEDNGNCTAVPAAHCPLLREYLDTGLTPESIEELKLSMMGKAISEITEFNGLPIDRLRELAEADKEGRVEVLPCKLGTTAYSTLDDLGRVHACKAEYANVYAKSYRNMVVLKPLDYKGHEYGAAFGAFGKTVFLTREEAAKELEAKSNG